MAKTNRYVDHVTEGLLNYLKCFFFGLLIALSKLAWKCLYFEMFLKLFTCNIM